MKIPPPPVSSPPPTSHARRKDLRPSFLRIASALLPLVSVAILCQSFAVAEEAQPASPEEFGRVYHCRPGPWGDLEYYYIYLEAPDRVVEHLNQPEPAPKWNFPGGTVEKVRELFVKAGLSKPLQNYLLAPAHHVFDDGVMTVFPPVPDLMAMTPDQRGIIYEELARSDLNPMHLYPARIYSGDLDSWLAQSELRPELGDAVRKLVYRRGDILCFSDVAAILSMADSAKEVHEFMKTMTRTRSLVLQLNVKSHTDFERAVSYWSSGERNEEIASIILPAVKTEGMERLDCVHLLPPLARRYLYTYPSEELAISANMPDCTWTALNFFSSTPLNYHADDNMFLTRINEDYDKVDPPYAFGDVLMYFAPEGNAIHSCVYIADDIVYTKNGQNRASPWILSKMTDVRRLYTQEPAITIQGYRLKSQRGDSGN